MTTNIEDVHKTALIDATDDIEHEDVAHLPIEDIKTIVHQRFEQRVQRYRDATEALITIDRNSGDR